MKGELNDIKHNIPLGHSCHVMKCMLYFHTQKNRIQLHRVFLYLEFLGGLPVKKTPCIKYWVRFSLVPPKMLKYGKPRSCESTLTLIVLDTPNLT